MAERIVIFGSPKTGETRTLYSPDALRILKATGNPCRAKRVSHIEVDQTKRGFFKGFYVDLRPVGGPKKKGFLDRGTALAFEHEWLISHRIPLSRAVRRGKKKQKPSR